MLRMSSRGGVMGLESIAMCHVIWFAGGERTELVCITNSYLLSQLHLRETQHSLTPFPALGKPRGPKTMPRPEDLLYVNHFVRERFSNSLSFPNSIAPRISTIPLPNPPNIPPPLEYKIFNRK